MFGIAICAWLVMCSIRAAHILDFRHKQRMLACVVMCSILWVAVAFLRGISGN